LSFGTLIAFNINKMEHFDEHAQSDHSLARDAGFMVYCKMFSDQVTNHLCEIRRQELNSRGIFSCNGCLATHGAGGEHNS
jgi:hypothetical protein